MWSFGKFIMRTIQPDGLAGQAASKLLSMKNARYGTARAGERILKPHHVFELTEFARR